jgi:hypothetical protein
MTNEEKTALRVACIHAAATLESYPGKIHDWAYIATVAAKLYNNVVKEMGLEGRDGRSPARVTIPKEMREI